MTANNLNTLSPLDGRYCPQVKVLQDYFSETSLIRHRMVVEVFYLISLTEFLNQNQLTSMEKKKLFKWLKSLDSKQFKRVLQIQEEIKHDVKAVEYFLKESLEKLGLSRLNHLVHWGLTSDDVNNLSYGLMISKAKNEVLLPSLLEFLKQLVNFSKQTKNTLMPARTHGQLALPTTFGKEFLVFAKRISFFYKKSSSLKLQGKLTGAVGTLAAHKFFFPAKNWFKFSQEFVDSLGLEPNLLTTQIEPGASLNYFFSLLKEISLVLLDFSQDCWFYISLDYLMQSRDEKEVGSSTMPQKVNPIKFENAEGNLKIAISLLNLFSEKFAVSRLQRDLSDSTVRRNVGVAFGHLLLSFESLKQGLQTISPNQSYLQKQLSNHPEMLSEALQLQLKLEGDSGAYEKIKQQTRGRQISWEQLVGFLPLQIQKKVKNWQVKDYVGLAGQLVDLEIKNIKKELKL